METKRLETGFVEKAIEGESPMTVLENLEKVEKLFRECNEALTEAGMEECDYQFQGEEIQSLMDEMMKQKHYADSAHQQVSNELDHPLYVDFKNNANETLSNIILGELTTENTFLMESHFQMTVQGGTYHTKQVKKKLTMEDFLGIKEITEETGMPVLEHVETIGEFASLFRENYDKMTEGKDVNTCLKEYMTMGEFDHKDYHPGKDFLSGLLDITVVKPFVECLTGKDLITKEKLTETEKGFKMAGVCIDIVTLGQGALAIKGMEQAGKLTAKQALQMIGKTMALDAVSGAAAYTAGYAGEAIGLPGELTWMLSMVTGCGVSMAGGKYILKNAKGIVKEITAEEAGEIVKKGLKGIEKGGVNFVDDVVEGGSEIIELSNSNIQHIKKHTFEGMAEQAKYLTDEQLANKLNNISFFNKNWSQDDIVRYTQEAYDTLRTQGKMGLQSVEINGEIINVFIKDDGIFDTAYGAYRYTIEDFR